MRFVNAIERPGRRRGASRASRGRFPARDEPALPSGVEEVYPIDLRRGAARSHSHHSGVAVRAGEYDLVVVARERVDPAHPDAPCRAGTLLKRLTLPDFAHPDLTTSSVILADRLTVLPAAPVDDQPGERLTL